MAEALVSTILQQLTTIVFQEVLKNVKLLKGVNKEVRKLENNLRSIKTLLEDAEEKQITDKAVRLWLNRLTEASLDMEDALDEWRTLLLYQPANAAESPPFLIRKVRFFLRCFSFRQIDRYRDIAFNIKEINESLDGIARERHNYQLTSKMTKQPKRKESTSLIDESTIVGRGEVKEEIISHLLCGTSKEEKGRPTQTISIVGMGGLGKTALAQMVYNDVKVKQHFPKRIWTCVSDVFDESKIAKAIIVALEGLEKLAILALESVSLNDLLERICNSIVGKKFLLILDDVWTEKDEDFEGLNVTFQHGAPDSRILVTTRKDNVARVMGSSHTIHLEKLSQDVCWSILRGKALNGMDKKICEDFKAVGMRIAEKCKGLPLVAKTLGGLLQFKSSKQEWEDVLNSELWRMDVVHKDVFVPLLLSYYDLPSSVRQCFTYCAIYAKDDVINTCHLIAHWRAQGYLGFDNGDDSLLELKGLEYFKCLEARSFFQDLDYVNYHFAFKMHDLVHDFALFLTKGEFKIEEVPKGDKNLKTNSERTCRHLTMMVEKGHSFPESISDAEKLRSIKSYGADADISNAALRNLFRQAKCLRLLDMEMRSYHGSTIPEEIGNLLHLRYLSLKHSRQLKRLPKNLCRLQNLQFLDLCRCFDLETLPDEMGNLVNLVLLRTTGCTRLTCYPKGVGKLTRLTQLIGLIVRVDRDDLEEFSARDLANLKQLRLLFMKVVGNTIDVEECKKVKLPNLQELKIWLRGNVQEADILEALNMSSVPRCLFQSNYHLNEGFGKPRNECQFYGF